MNRECYSLGGLKGQTEETLAIGRGRASQVVDVVAAGSRDLGQSVSDPRRLVALAAVGHRRKIRRIGFDEQTIPRHEPEKIVVRPLVERHDAAERDVPAGIDGELREGVRPRIAMQHTDDSSCPRLADDRARVVLRVAGMDYHRAVRVGGECHLRGESRALRLARGVVVVVVEPALSHRNRAGLEERADLRDVAPCVELDGIMRVDAGRREHEPRVLRGDPGSGGGGFDRLADADDRARARIAGAGDYRAAVAGEGRVREVGVAVDED